MNSGRCIIIAEAGVNHNGSLELAKKLVDVASDAGADFIKFQTFKTELIISKAAIKADYQVQNTNVGIETQFEMVKKLELSYGDFEELQKYCSVKKIGFLSSAFDLPSIDFLDSIGQPLFKIPSGEITNKPYLQHIAKKGKPVVISTGMADLGEIEDAVDIFIEANLKREDITILHCNSEYPTPMEDVNLKAMLTLRDAFKVNIGYSDHTLGIEIPVAAVTLGATVIEKHFTLDKNLPGPDHKASLLPEELKAMVLAIRNVEKSISGKGIKKPSSSEMKNIALARKRIVALTDITEGDYFNKDNICLKRNNEGLSAKYWEFVIGKKANKNYFKDEGIDFN
jgi:N,N'-diacetyllegionaminate synthase